MSSIRSALPTRFGRTKQAAAASVVAAVLASSVVAASAAPAAPNLLKNGGADLGPGVSDASGVTPTIPGWLRTGDFTVVKYGASGGFPDKTISQTIGGKGNFFAGGPSNPKSGATQIVNLARFGSAIDAGKKTATLSGHLGGYSSQADSLTVTATFLTATGEKLGVLKIGPVSAGARNNATTLLQKAASKLVPAKTRSIEVKLTAARTSGSYNDGYADNLALTLGAA